MGGSLAGKIMGRSEVETQGGITLAVDESGGTIDRRDLTRAVPGMTVLVGGLEGDWARNFRKFRGEFLEEFGPIFLKRSGD